METSLQGANLMAKQIQTLEATHGVGEQAEEEHQVHLPNPSGWPIMLSVAVGVAVVGLFFIPESPWLTIIAAPFVLVGIMGWALEDPMASPHHQTSTANAYRIPRDEKELLEQAQNMADQVVTVSSTAYSTHFVRVESEGDGVLSLYGKVELEAQRDELEEDLRKLPGVTKVQNYVVAEDSILNIAHSRLDDLQEKGKLPGAKDISMLVENYILHLYGQVPDRDMKYMLEREMIGIPGVKVIVNHIGLNKDIPGNLGKTRNR